ncbi:LOG family protein [Halobacillus hunanensis]|uniref:LOG family protein n=1 Tax=Halobacillus hunanensis TaxID=578214 RepID=UPI0009A878FE|nr:TIGR00730 family Rossman fold protein [Halobacillus hunanensis]
MNRICVYAGSKPGSNQAFAAQSKVLGEVFAEKQIELVYGGAKSGLMGELADAILASGGSVTGIMPTPLFEKEIAHQKLTSFIEVKTMHERKAKMSELADGFIALPGGFGTFEELFETITWAQIGLHTKPIALLNTENYYTPLLNLIEHAIQAGFVAESNRSLILQAAEPGELVEKMESWLREK